MLAAVAVLLVACGGGRDDEAWGGYTQDEAREVYLSDALTENLKELQLDPAELQPTEEDLEEHPIIKTYLDGRQVWEYRDPEARQCLYVRKDPVYEEFVYEVRSC